MNRDLSVLLVEDDADQRDLMACMLRAEGCNVVELASGIALLDWIGLATSNAAPAACDVVVSDVDMPDLTGIEVFASWRYGGWSVPIIFVTASEDPQIRAEAKRLGASVVTKPFRSTDLIGAIDRVSVQGHPAERR